MHAHDPPGSPTGEGPEPAAGRRAPGGRGSRPSRPFVLPALFLLAVAGLTGRWWLRRDAEAGALDAALAPYARAPLPAPDDPVDAELAALGAEVFRARCSACHAVTGESRIGPDLAGVTLRREGSWIRAMILAPDSMIRADPLARALREAAGVPMMVPGGMDPARARAVLEFLRRVDGVGG